LSLSLDATAKRGTNQRVIVPDRTITRIVWQYGVTGVPGREPGYLRNPDGVDIKPAAFGR